MNSQPSRGLIPFGIDIQIYDWVFCDGFLVLLCGSTHGEEGSVSGVWLRLEGLIPLHVVRYMVALQSNRERKKCLPLLSLEGE